MDSDSSDDKMSNQHKKRNSQLNPKGNTVGRSRKLIEKEKAKDFFKDL